MAPAKTTHTRGEKRDERFGKKSNSNFNEKKKIKKIIVSHDHEGELKNDSEVHFFFFYEEFQKFE